MELTAKPPAPPYEPTHVPTNTPHVWRDVATNRFVCEDETQDFFGDYATEEAAAAALKVYCDTVLATRVEA